MLLPSYHKLLGSTSNNRREDPQETIFLGQTFLIILNAVVSRLCTNVFSTNFVLMVFTFSFHRSCIQERTGGCICTVQNVARSWICHHIYNEPLPVFRCENIHCCCSWCCIHHSVLPCRSW